MNSGDRQRAESLLSMNIQSMKLRIYIFASIAVLLGLVFFLANYPVIAIGEFLFAFLLLTVRLRYLSMVELMQNYVREKIPETS